MNELLDKIDDELFDDNCNTEIIENKYASDKIVWKDSFGTGNYVLEQHIDSNGEHMAWWQYNDVGKELLRIKLDNFILNWRPPVNSMGGSMGCIYLKFYNEWVITAFPDKHYEKLFALNTKTQEVKNLFFCYSIAVCLVGDYLYVQDKSKNENFKYGIKVSLDDKIKVEESELVSKNITLINRHSHLDKG